MKVLYPAIISTALNQPTIFQPKDKDFYMLDLLFEENRRKLLQLAALGFLLFVSVTTMHAQTTSFADFSQVSGSAKNFSFTNNGAIGPGANGFFDAPSGNPIFFRYVGINGLPAGNYPAGLENFQSATLNIFNATTSTLGTSVSGNTAQPIDNSIIIVITRDTPFMGNNVLLRVEIASTTVGLPASGPYPALPASTTATDLLGTTGGSQATFGGSTPGQSIRFTSDFIDFTQTNIRSLSIGLTGLSTPFSLNVNNILNTFTASGTGSFSTDITPTYNPPTAASVNIGGRVMNAAGRAVAGARVSLIDSNGTAHIVISNSFGYYRFGGVGAGQTVVVSVSAKRYAFSPQIVSVSNELTDLNFTAQQ